MPTNKPTPNCWIDSIKDANPPEEFSDMMQAKLSLADHRCFCTLYGPSKEITERAMTIVNAFNKQASSTALVIHKTEILELLKTALEKANG